jgi:hypothetical protein
MPHLLFVLFCAFKIKVQKANPSTCWSAFRVGQKSKWDSKVDFSEKHRYILESKPIKKALV